ncbi:tetratricopeptide repeat protein [Streptomyces sp. CA-135486]|uniref:tetratricopeptide repeat protein n=1 Tax=Streptomyces sp. CA-135486 TaxID=3240049 RepID=UPI003D8BFC5D
MTHNEISDGVFFNVVVQGQTVTLQLPREITPALAGLPPASGTFTGRDDQLKELLGGLDPEHPQTRAVLVWAVAGLGGVGKTELVLQAAHHALAQQGWFPGGVLFVDLFGYDSERRLTPEAALGSLLRALGMPDEHVPADLQERARLYRSVLSAYADQGRRLLVVVDNASAGEQAAPLLPSDPRIPALVTSRHRLADLDARLYNLDVLDPEPAVDLLRQALLAACGPGDTRVNDAPEQSELVAERCGYLPLALRIVAALLAELPDRPMRSMAEALVDAHRRLDRLRRGDRAVRAAFSLSYEHLPEDQARLFRLLSANPGQDISTESAAHLVGAEVYAAEELLVALARGHLIEPGVTYGRWRLHDLMRLYAEGLGRDHAEGDDRDEAVARLLGHLSSMATAAGTYLHFEQEHSPRFATRAEAMSWFDVESPNLMAVATAAPALGHPDTTIDLLYSLGHYFVQRRSFDECLNLGHIVLELARASGKRNHEAAALQTLGIALDELRRFEEAVDAHSKAVAIVAETANRYEKGRALGNLGNALWEAGRIEEAVDAQSEAIAIFREVGASHAEGRSLTNLGTALWRARRFEEAIDAHAKAIAIHRKSGDRLREGRAMGSLGNALWGIGRFEEAIAAFITTVALFRESGDRYDEGVVLGNLAYSLRQVQRLEEAIDAYIKAIAIFGEFGDRSAEDNARRNLAIASNERWSRN